MTSAPLGPRRRAALRVLGLLFTAIGAAGVVVPLLPGVPFLILAAACFARSSPRLEAWLLDHPFLGPGVRRWRERGAISRKSKFLAVSMMSVSGVFVVLSAAPVWGKASALGLMAVGAVFVLTRPND